MKRTKIVSTIGPATDDKQKIAELIEEGVDVARLNFSHVTHEEHEQTLDKIRSVSEKTAVMADTKGPEIRLGEVESHTVLTTGDKIKLKYGDKESNDEEIYINNEKLVQNIEKGDEVVIDDGKIELTISSIEENYVECTIVHGGEISDRKAVNVPGKNIGLTAPTKKDREDIEFAAQKGFDFISLSFVKSAEDVRKTRKLLEKNNSNAQIISKIEHAKAVENFDEILEVSDAIMVARGDLGVEIPAAKLPTLQKEMISKCNKAGKPVITATQMLESMTENPTATRAEISDVANAVIDGSDAVMLSGETAIGEYPVKTVEFMRSVVEEVESTITDRVHHTVKDRSQSITEIICKNVWQATREDEIKYIAVHTTSGSTARNVAKHRPDAPIVAFSHSAEVERQLQLVWGVKPLYEESEKTTEEMIKSSASRLKRLDMAEEEDNIVITAGMPPAKTGTTNMMQIRSIGDILNDR